MGKRAWLCLLLGAFFGLTTSAQVSAAPAKKKPTLVKAVKKVAPLQKSAPRRSGHLAANEEESSSLPKLASTAVAVIDQSTGEVLYEKNPQAVLPIASITKLMTAMVVLDAQLDLQEKLRISEEDLDTLKGTHSRLAIGTELSREEMLLLALMASENRAAAALSRYYPGGRPAFVAAMNAKAKLLGMTDTHFADPTGLTPENVSSARDLVRLVEAANHYPLIREFSTAEEHRVMVRGRPVVFRNTNALVKHEGWRIDVQKTGYISEAGKCLVMQAWLASKPVIIVLLDSWGKLTRIADANRIKRWVETRLASGPTAMRS
ncbi:MAG: D-alanyl-D-alanine endopeptidase [Rhodocyclaceae bacterium]|nr:D-alanyl-D-alanine endopeptidase [Rhodocyclaceae bacterium]